MTSLDHTWYQEFKPLASYAVYEYLNGESTYREEQKASFIEGKIRAPKLDYPDIDPNHWHKVIQSLRSLKQRILDQEKNKYVKTAYQQKINEKISDAQIIIAAQENNMLRFKQLCEFSFGKPTQKVFRLLCNRLIAINDHKFENRAKLPPFVKPYLATVSSNTDQTIKEVGNADLKREVFKEQDDLDKSIILNNEANYSGQEIKEIFEASFSSYNILGWKVRLATNSQTAISVSQSEKSVIVPQGRKVSGSKLRGLILHEIGTHVARREKGENSRLQLLGLGLARYESGDEGLAMFKESQVLDNPLMGIDGYLAISLAYGLDGKAKDFRETYEALLPYFEWKNSYLATDATGIKSRAYQRTLRTFRGTDCLTPGVAFTKDLAYYRGLEYYRNNSGLSSNYDELHVGKWNPADQTHRQILKGCEII